MNGYGKLIFVSGDVYEGYYKDDLMHGQGFYYWNDGSKYDG